MKVRVAPNIRVPKEYRAIKQAVERTPGWHLERSRRNPHVKVKDPTGHIVISIPASGSDCRNIRNDTSAVRRAGLAV